MDEVELVPETEDRQKIPFVTIACCVWAVVTFIALSSVQDMDWGAAMRWGYYPPDAVYSGAWWAMVTSAFIHVDLIHLAFNLYWIWILGSVFERAYGSLAMAAFVVATAFVSSGVEMFAGGWGVGLSGVGYALFGFGWLARSAVPAFREAVDDRVVQIFIGWGILMVVVTYMGIFEVGNFAHLGGLLTGAALGAAIARPRLRPAMAVSIVALLAVSVLSIFWSPLSVNWVSFKASEAMAAARYDESTRLLRRSLQMGQDPAWVWESLAMVYGYQDKKAEYTEAVRKLRELSPEAAAKIEKDYGPAS